MNKLKYLLIGSFIAPTAAITGGMERTALPTAFMFEKGGYADFTYSNRNYDVTDNFFAPTSSMYGDVSGASISVKFDVNESFSSYLKDLKTWIIINLNLIVLYL